MNADDLRALLDATQPSCKTLDLATEQRPRDRQADADDIVSDAIVEATAGETVSLAYSREIVHAFERHAETDHCELDGCAGTVSGTDASGRPWVVSLYNGAEG